MPDRKPKPESVSPGSHAAKDCAACGRTITWRKKWERDWDNVRFCSDACRSRGHSAASRQQDHALEQMILALLHARGQGKTICPSEAARAVAASDVRELWQPLMEPARAAARRLVAAGKIVVTQQGVVIDASTAKGAIRLRLR